MANKTTTNPFAIYQVATKTAIIEALNGAEIEYRELTMEEEDRFQASVVKGIDENGKPQLDMDRFREVKYEKVAAGLINPAMTVDELKALSKGAGAAISEILKLVSVNEEAEEDEGN